MNLNRVIFENLFYEKLDTKKSRLPMTTLGQLYLTRPFFLRVRKVEVAMLILTF